MFPAATYFCEIRFWVMCLSPEKAIELAARGRQAAAVGCQASKL